jgi:hemolysin III
MRKAHYSLGHEISNSVSHGVGAVFSVIGLILLVIRAVGNGDPWQVVSVSIFGTSMVLLYTSSTLYHALIPPRARRIFKILDHSMIYILIAGTYTPFLLISLRGGWGWSMFGVVWGVSIIGIVLKVFYAGRFKLISTLLYLALGWMAMIAIKPMMANVPTTGLLWLLAGGGAYSIGTIFYMWRKVPYHHAIWHLFVICGTVCHFKSIYSYLLTA